MTGDRYLQGICQGSLTIERVRSTKGVRQARKDATPEDRCAKLDGDRHTSVELLAVDMCQPFLLGFGLKSEEPLNVALRRSESGACSGKIAYRVSENCDFCI